MILKHMETLEKLPLVNDCCLLIIIISKKITK